MPDARSSEYLRAWQLREELAEAIVPLVGALYRDHALVVAVFGASLVHKTPHEILTLLAEAERYAGKPLPMADVVALLRLMNESDLGRARIDIGKLLMHYSESEHPSLESWANEVLAPLSDAPQRMPGGAQDVVLYGFGRIGRLLARILIGKTGGGDKYRLRAIVLRPSSGDLRKRASLLRRDSVHGQFRGTIEVDEEHNALIINGNMVRVIYANGPDEVDYTAYGIEDAVVIDNTGKWRDREGLSLHLKAPGASKVILTAPGKGDVPNLVFGVNHTEFAEGEQIFSAASCTTNAIVPVLKVVNDVYGLANGHVETIHAYTNDQNLIDNFHKKARRGRSAALNMVITETGAASAVAKALPELAGKLTGSAIRVPTPNVSLAILNLNLEREVTRDALNETFRQAAMDSELAAQIDYSVSPEVVSSDLVGNHHACIIDSVATIADGRRCVLYAWYDNEFGYSCQVVRLLQHIVGVSPRVFPAPGELA